MGLPTESSQSPLGGVCAAAAIGVAASESCSRVAVAVVGATAASCMQRQTLVVACSGAGIIAASQGLNGPPSTKKVALDGSWLKEQLTRLTHVVRSRRA